MTKVSEIQEAIINYQGVDLNITYVFEGLERELKVLLINNAPDFFFSKNVREEVEFLVSEEIIKEAQEKKEYLEEMRADEGRGN